MAGFIFDSSPYGLWHFLVLTCVLGGLAAFASGRAIAQTWRSIALVPAYCIALMLAVRFLHYAVFEGSLTIMSFYATDLAFLLIISGLGYALARSKQMSRQYGFDA